jgi:hypothetical protein
VQSRKGQQVARSRSREEVLGFIFQLAPIPKEQGSEEGTELIRWEAIHSPQQARPDGCYRVEISGQESRWWGGYPLNVLGPEASQFTLGRGRDRASQKQGLPRTQHAHGGSLGQPARRIVPVLTG